MATLNGRPVFNSIESARGHDENGMQAKVVFAFETVDELNASKQLMDYYITSSPYITVVPPKLEFPLYGAAMVGIFRHETTLLQLKNNLVDERAQLMKRVFDVVVSSIIFIMAMPFILVLGMIIKSVGGPIFFKHTRIDR